MHRGRIAWLTLDDCTGYVIDDALAIDAMRARGWAVDEVSWRARASWGDFDAALVRTTWDYTEHLDAFLATLAAVERAGIAVANPLRVVRWNANKHYLRDLAARGVATVPTAWGEGLDRDEVRSLFERFGRSIVVKPVVGANARDTFVLTADDENSWCRALEQFAGTRAWMAQPFVRSVVDEGEISLFYFDGVYSHAITKTPAHGDFRVQEEHGGIIRALIPAPDVHAAAERVLAALDETLLQARVDLVRLDDGTLALMECELIEPSLYFRMDRAAPDAFVTAFERWFARRP